MNEDNVTLLIETAERAKSNSHRIDSMEKRVESIENDQKAIYEIATSVKLIVQQIKHIDEKVDDTNNKLDAQSQAWKESEKRLSERITETESKPLRQQADNINKIKIAIVTAICTTMATGALAAIVAFMK